MDNTEDTDEKPTKRRKPLTEEEMDDIIDYAYEHGLELDENASETEHMVNLTMRGGKPKKQRIRRKEKSDVNYSDLAGEISIYCPESDAVATVPATREGVAVKTLIAAEMIRTMVLNQIAEWNKLWGEGSMPPKPSMLKDYMTVFKDATALAHEAWDFGCPKKGGKKLPDAPQMGDTFNEFVNVKNLLVLEDGKGIDMDQAFQKVEKLKKTCARESKKAMNKRKADTKKAVKLSKDIDSIVPLINLEG